MTNIRGRFQKAAADQVLKYTESISFDWRLYRQDITGSIAHAKMLAKQGIITAEEAETIIKGLNAIRREIEQGKLKFKTELEDIHMNIEARLTEKVGEVGGKLHTARSRNDQVALDIRLYTKETITEAIKKLRELQSVLITLAEKYKDVVVPGYTHLQPAQPVLFTHHMLAYFEMFLRDVERFGDCFKRTDVLPLGSGALAGVTYNIDREFVARELGFSRVSRNSMDAVADRDFIIEFEAIASISMMHISRLAEEIILWSAAEFGFIELDEAYTTGSSIMPQKKNPDVAELARGKTGRVYGNLMAILTTMKGLPLAYNRDMQEDKEGFFDTVDTYFATLEVFTGMVKTIKVNTKIAREALERGYLLATDLADYLVKKGVSFRQAHNIVGRLVSYAVEKDKSFEELKLAVFRKFSPLFEKDVYDITIESSIAARDVIGGTAHKRVRQALTAAKKLLGDVSARK
jgi:argininosuccinate lyase